MAQLPIEKKSEESLEIPIEQIYRPGSALDVPVRPAWNYQMTKEQLEQQEQTYFNVREIRVDVGERIDIQFRVIWKKSLRISMQNISVISK